MKLEVKDFNLLELASFLHLSRIWMIEINKLSTNKKAWICIPQISTPLQIRQEIAIFSKLCDFKYCSLLKVLLRCAVLAEFELHPQKNWHHSFYFFYLCLSPSIHSFSHLCRCLSYVWNPSFFGGGACRTARGSSTTTTLCQTKLTNISLSHLYSLVLTMFFCLLIIFKRYPSPSTFFWVGKYATF